MIIIISDHFMGKFADVLIRIRATIKRWYTEEFKEIFKVLIKIACKYLVNMYNIFYLLERSIFTSVFSQAHTHRHALQMAQFYLLLKIKNFSTNER